ncbi:MAG: glyoxylase-like metal-dependent hydrolase (beta-lactamase superfamily II) [Gammaproteobacteria bacterium]|jgi:glyoxylase-like metal-dependent hydrolase (beta-lactamase superfamily II)
MARPPNSSQVEITGFGTGYGECIVCHLGGGIWMIVDSLIARGETEPVAITYLESPGIKPASAVQLITVTHWHDDHVRGLSNIVKRCPNAVVVASDALSRDRARSYFDL